MGRHDIYLRGLARPPGAPRWSDPYFCEWSAVVGGRIRRRRRDRGWTLKELSGSVHKPEGGHYSGGYFSRVERGWASAPLYVYLAIADVLEVEPGRLLGPDDVQKPVSDAELTLLRVLRRIELAPDEAIARLTPTATPVR